jgi:lipoprotein-releasing system permease protein
MYKLHLILKYLRKRRIAWVSLLAVTLCTAMVLVVISVMGGWLRMFRTSFHGLSGDIVVQADSLSGFPYYDDIIAQIEKLPEVGAAVPVIQTFGLININNRKTTGVQVLGYPIDRIGLVNDFPHSLWRQYQQWTEWADGAAISPGDRQRLREVDHLADIRPPTPLLTLSRDERDRIRKALHDAAKKIEVLRQNATAAANDEVKQAKLTQDLNLAIEAERAMRDLLDAPDGAPATSFDRRAIREAFGGNIVDDPDVRLAPNDAERKICREQAQNHVKNVSFKPFLPPDVYKRDFQLTNPKAKPELVNAAANWDGMICGTGVVNIHKDETGKLVNREDYLYRLPVSLTVVGVSPTGKFDFGGKAERNYWIVDTSRTKVWQYDSNTVYVPFDKLQIDLGMDEQKAEQDGKEITIPARTREIHVRVKEPFASNAGDLIALRDRIKLLVRKVLSEKRYTQADPAVRTWEESQAKWLGAIEKEKVLVTGLFGLISIVAIFLIFCIFYMIVVEKTRDIGIIKSVGATSSGVAGIFLGYGATIGILGAGVGFAIGYLIIHNINTIHGWLGSALGVVIWDPEVYAFDTIPNTMDPRETTVIISIAIISSILGALVPAVVAARKHPVEALRWE